MFDYFSKTQTANYIAFAMFVVQLFSLNVSQVEVTTIVSAITGLAGAISVVVAFVERYKKGDLKISGVRK